MSDRLTDEDLAAMQERATLPPHTFKEPLNHAGDQYRRDVPRLLSEVRALREELAEAEKRENALLGAVTQMCIKNEQEAADGAE